MLAEERKTGGCIGDLPGPSRRYADKACRFAYAASITTLSGTSREYRPEYRRSESRGSPSCDRRHLDFPVSSTSADKRKPTTVEPKHKMSLS